MSLNFYTFNVYVQHVSATQGRVIFRQHIIKESTALCTLSTVLVGYVLIIVNFGVTGCLFFLFLYCSRSAAHWVYRPC
jgi:hypothetical protein